MNQARGTGWSEPRSIAARGLAAILLAMLLGLLAPRATLAHPLDEHLQATYITVGPTRIEVELDLSPGVLVAPQLLTQLGADGDQEIADAEARSYVDAVLRNVMLQVDGQPLVLEVTRIEMPSYLNIQAGYGTIRVFTSGSLSDEMTGTHQIAYTNNYAPPGSPSKPKYQVNAFVDRDSPITLGKQNRDAIQQNMTMDYVIGGEPIAAIPIDGPITVPAGATGQAQRLLGYLDAPALSP